MTTETFTAAPAGVIPAPRPAPDAVAAAVGPMPWLTATGRLDQVLTAWARGHLAEVPTGLGFDVLQVPGPLARETVARMREAGRRVGPVVLGPSGGEFILALGSAPRTAPGTTLLRPGALVLLPPPTAGVPELVGSRGWLVPPTQPGTGAPLCAEVTPGGALLEPYLAAVQAAADCPEEPGDT